MTSQFAGLASLSTFSTWCFFRLAPGGFYITPGGF